MKKRRKKNPLYTCLNPTLLSPISLGSAPDVPKYETLTDDSFEVQDFIDGLLGYGSRSDDVSPLIFVSHLTDKITIKWISLVLDDTMYVKIPSSMPWEGSKESFVSLLEYAEEKLNLSNVIACIDARNVNRSVSIRTFMYIGFEPIPPGTCGEINSLKQFVLLSYEI